MRRTDDPTSAYRIFRSYSLTAMALLLSLGASSFAQGAEPAGTNARKVTPVLSQGDSLPIERLRWHTPDPSINREAALKRLETLRERGEKSRVKFIERTLEIASPICRQEILELSLEAALRRALANNYAIDVQRFNPAVETTRVIEAEAAFDATFFANAIKNNIDRPTASALQANDVDLTSLAAGIRKALPTGATISASWELNRTKTTLSFQTINPEYVTGLVLDIRQPLLRNFGVDVTQSIIRLRKNDRRVSKYAFHRQVRDVLRQTEEAYWRLVQARADVVISARLLAQFEQILVFLQARRDFDVNAVQLSATQANLQQERTAFVRRLANVFDAEDQLIALMNSDDIDLADTIEIIPTDLPNLTRLVVDPLAEVQSGLEHRPEIHEQELRVASARIAVGQAKSAELPRFDLTFRTASTGLATNSAESFDNASTYNFVEYRIGVEIEMPIGNRGPRAVYRRSQLQHEQQVAALKQTFEEVILDINLAVRQVATTFDQIAPSFESAEARHREVDSIVARQERKDLNTLNSELAARRALAESRRAMLRAVVDYNIAVVNLERAKGTLLRYNNVVLPFDHDS